MKKVIVALMIAFSAPVFAQASVAPAHQEEPKKQKRKLEGEERKAFAKARAECRVIVAQSGRGNTTGLRDGILGAIGNIRQQMNEVELMKDCMLAKDFDLDEVEL